MGETPSHEQCLNDLKSIAYAYKSWIKDFNMTHEESANIFNKLKKMLFPRRYLQYQYWCLFGRKEALRDVLDNIERAIEPYYQILRKEEENNFMRIFGQPMSR